MGDCFDKYGHRPDSGHGPSGRTTVRPEFWDFRWKSFLFESRVRTVRHCCPNGRTSAASNFHIRLHTSRLGDGRPDGWSSTRNFHICWPRVRTMADWRPDGWIWIAILALWSSASGRESTSSGRLQQSSHIWTWKEIWSLITESRPDGLLSRSNGCKLEQKLLNIDECPDGNPRRPDGWCFGLSGIRMGWHVVRMAGTMDRWASGRGWHVVRKGGRE